jgi:hypothetical protein
VSDPEEIRCIVCKLPIPANPADRVHPSVVAHRVTFPNGQVAWAHRVEVVDLLLREKRGP